MKVTEHPGVPRPTSMTLQTDPMVVWLSKTVELTIDAGDQLSDVARVVHKYWKVGGYESHRITAFWFAIGERQYFNKHKKDFSKRELSTKGDRRYLEP